MPEFLGLANQNCSSSPDTAGSTTAPYVAALNPGDTAWTCPATGYYTLTARGGGATTASGSPSAGATQKTELIRIGEVVTLSIGRGAQRSGAMDGEDTTVTFPSGHVMVAGGGKTAGTVGTATGGDLNVVGLASAGGGLGGNAPAIGDFPAAITRVSQLTDGPGTGGSSNGSTIANSGGPGIVYVVRGKAPRIL